MSPVENIDAELKPCPFCGARLVQANNGWMHPKASMRSCASWSIVVYSDEDAVAWNTRAGEAT